MSARRARIVAALAVAVPLLGYPAIVLADGARLPASDCVDLAEPGEEGELDLVFARRDTIAEAEALLVQVVGVGYRDAEIQHDGCMRWKVLYDGIERYDQGLESRAEARGAGLEAELEIERPG